MTSLSLLLLAVAAPAELPLDAATRARLPVVEAVLVGHGTTMRCSGVRLSDLASAAGLPAGKALTGDALATLIIAEARDGYRVAFTLGEIDPLLGNRAVVLADRCNGRALTAEDGPLRLVVPGEQRAARSLRQLERLRIVAAAPRLSGD